MPLVRASVSVVATETVWDAARDVRASRVLWVDWVAGYAGHPMILNPDDYEQLAALMPISELPEGEGFGIDVGTVQSPVVAPGPQGHLSGLAAGEGRDGRDATSERLK